MRRSYALAFGLAVLAPRAFAAVPYDPAPIDALIQSRLGPIGPGAAFLLAKDGVVIHRRAYGTYSTTTTVLVASASKWLSGALVMRLVDEGALSLDDTAGRYIPSFATGPKAAITLRQLYSHTSGLPGGQAGDAPCLDDRTTTLAACADQIAGLSLLATPGTAFNYGGNSMQVAARMAEVATGKRWRDLFRDEIADPLGMTRTSFGFGDNPLVAGGAVSCVDDYGAFLQMLVAGGTWQGKRILSEAAIGAMLQDETDGAAIAYSPWTSFEGLDPSVSKPVRYGIGNWREVVDPVTGAAVESSSHGAFGTGPWMDRSRGLAGILLVFDKLEDVVPTYFDVKNLIRAQIPAAPRAPAAWILPSSARAPGVGGAFYTTDLFVANPGPAAASYTLKFLGHDGDGRAGLERIFTLAPGRGATYADVLGSVFGRSSDYGAIRVASDAPNLLVSSQTSTPGGGGTFGQSVPASGSGDLVTAATPRTILGVREDGAFRTNLVLANASESAAEATATLVSAAGATLGAKTIVLPPLGMTQVTRVVRDLGVSADVAGARLVLSTTTPGGAFAAYASVIDGVTNDPRTLLPR